LVDLVAVASPDYSPFIVNFHLADGLEQDGRISKREFKKACIKGLVKYPFR
jgi:hypothetical protein